MGLPQSFHFFIIIISLLGSVRIVGKKYFLLFSLNKRVLVLSDNMWVRKTSHKVDAYANKDFKKMCFKQTDYKNLYNYITVVM